jgi:hypothetical protein
MGDAFMRRFATSQSTPGLARRNLAATKASLHRSHSALSRLRLRSSRASSAKTKIDLLSRPWIEARNLPAIEGVRRRWRLCHFQAAEPADRDIVSCLTRQPANNADPDFALSFNFATAAQW